MPALDMVDTLFLQLAAAPVEAKVQANNCSTVLTVRQVLHRCSIHRGRQAGHTLQSPVG